MAESIAAAAGVCNAQNVAVPASTQEMSSKGFCLPQRIAR